MSSSTVFEQAQAVATVDKQAGINMFQKIIGTENGDYKNNEEQLRIQEQSIFELAELYAHNNRATELGNLIKEIRPFLNFLSKAKASKLVRTLVDLFLDMNADTGLELEICEDCIEWAKTEKRIFLRQKLEVRLMALLYENKWFTKALQLGRSLVKELQKIEDKQVLIEVYLLECKTYYSLENLFKAKASLTSARTLATTTYCELKLQAELDLQSGVLQAAAEHDFTTACSYFHESLENFDACNCPRALSALKYMLLCKIMLNMPEDIQTILLRSVASKYSGNEITAMKEIAKAVTHNSLTEFETTLAKYNKEIVNDPVIQMHLESLNDIMFERNISDIVLPYSKVQIEFIASKIGVNKEKVEKKLSQMVLDKKIRGILDQEADLFILLDEPQPSEIYENGVDVIKYLGKFVDTLYLKASKNH